MHRHAFFPPLASTARRTLAGGLVLATGLAAAPAAGAASPRSWQSYVLGPASPTVTAIRVEGRGQVTNPEALVRGHGRTTLTTVAGRTPASVVLDFGKDVAGTPHVDVTSASGPATPVLVTGEAWQFPRAGASSTCGSRRRRTPAARSLSRPASAA